MLPESGTLSLPPWTLCDEAVCPLHGSLHCARFWHSFLHCGTVLLPLDSAGGKTVLFSVLFCALFSIIFLYYHRSYRIKKTTRSPRFLSKDLGRFILVFYDALNRAVSPARQLFAWGFFCPWGGK